MARGVSSRASRASAGWGQPNIHRPRPCPLRNNRALLVRDHATGRAAGICSVLAEAGLDDLNKYTRGLGVVVGGVLDAARAVEAELAKRHLPPLARDVNGRVLNLQARAVEVGLDDYNPYLRSLGVKAGGVLDAARAVAAELAAHGLPPLAYDVLGRVLHLQARAVEVGLQYSCTYLKWLTVCSLRNAEERIAFLVEMNDKIGLVEPRVDFTKESIVADARAFLSAAVPGLIDGTKKPYLVQVFYAGGHRITEETERQLRYSHVKEYMSLPSATDALRAYGWRSHHVEQRGAEYALALEAAVQRIIIDAGVALRPIDPGDASARLFSNAGVGWGGENVHMGCCGEYSCPSLTLPPPPPLLTHPPTLGKPRHTQSSSPSRGPTVAAGGLPSSATTWGSPQRWRAITR